MSSAALIALFRRLPPPALTELDGEFRASLLDQGSLAAELVAHAMVNLPGRWLGKAFAPRWPDGGHGYNSFRTVLGVRRALRMRTWIGASALDDGSSFHLDYSPFNRGPIATMRDELRRVGEGRYLGIGRLGYSERQRRHLFPFLLEGPIAPFVPLSRW